MSVKQTKIFAHRGIPDLFPENSLEGFKYAIDHHADGIEFDVHLTKDNIPVIIHDEKIDRTANGQGFIKDFTFCELSKFKLKNGETIPRLSDFLNLAEGKDVILNLEFKTDHIHYKGIEKIVFEEIKRHDFLRPIIYSSFNLNSLKTAYQLDPNGTYCFLSDKKIDQFKKFVAENHLSGLHLDRYQNTDEIPLRVWTVDDPKEQKKLFELGVAGIFTNNFQQAGKILSEKKPA